MFKMKLLLGVLAVIFSVSATSIHAQVIIFQEDFSGAATSDLNGTTPAIAPTAASWVSEATSINADGSTLFASNSLASFDIGNVINDTKGTPDGLFELTATLDQPSGNTGAGNNWYSIGFSQDASPTTNSNFLGRNGVGSIILRSSGELDMWAGNGFTPNGLTPTGSSNTIDGPNGTTGPRTLTVELDLRNWNGMDDFGTVTFSDSDIEGPVGTFNYTNTPILANTGELGSIPTDPDFNSIMLSGSSAAGGTVGVYSSLTLTQMTSTVVLLGDVNLDGAVDFLDITPFIAVLSNGGNQAEADVDESGMVDFLDIVPFIAILSGS